MGHDVDVDRQRSNWTVIRPWRELVRSNDINGMIGVVRQYGWLPALFGLVLHSLARGAFEYLSEPFIIVEGYVFPGWPAALIVNTLFGTFVVAFSWFCYFGLVGVIAGFLSNERDMSTDVFKFGGYLTVLFAPVFLVGTALIATVSAPGGMNAEALAGSGDGSAEFAMTAYSFVYDTPQMQVVRILKAVAWIATGFLLLPVVQHLYGLDEKRSVASVLPVTLASVLTAFLL